MIRAIRPCLGQGPVAPITELAVKIVEALPDGGTVYVARSGTPVLVVPFVPLQITRLYGVERGP